MKALVTKSPLMEARRIKEDLNGFSILVITSATLNGMVWCCSAVALNKMEEITGLFGSNTELHAELLMEMMTSRQQLAMIATQFHIPNPISNHFT